MSNLEAYERAIEPARKRFAQSPQVQLVIASSMSADQLELFLINFSSYGVRMTQPVDHWIRRAGQQCSALGLEAVGRALVLHAEHEAGHHELMIRDTYALAAHWNNRHDMKLNAESLLGRSSTPGIDAYVELHEAVINSSAPYSQLAIEYEIEGLSVRFGGAVIRQCIARIGYEAATGLSFLEEHVALDAGHTRFNANELERLLVNQPSFLNPLVDAGTRALDTYSAFLSDCIRSTQEQLAIMTTKHS
jgi:hypothetical protein